jgi:hypothetical protein
MDVQNTTCGHRTSCELTRCAFPCDLTPTNRKSASRRAQAVPGVRFPLCLTVTAGASLSRARVDRPGQSFRPSPASMCTRVGVVSVPGPGRQSTTFTKPGSTSSQPVKNSMNCARDLATAGVWALW